VLTRDAAGRFWVVNGNRKLQSADVVSFDATGTPLLRAGLPGHAEPYALAATATQILVTDPDRVMIDAIDPTSGTVLAFGDASFHEWLGTLRKGRAPFQAVASGAYWAIVLWPGVAVGCGIYVLCDRSRRRLGRRMPISRPLAMNLVGDVRWLAPDPKLMAERRRLVGVLSLAVCVVPLGFLMALWLRDPHRLTPLLAGEVDLLAHVCPYWEWGGL
jgi:hypothetical protein